MHIVHLCQRFYYGRGQEVLLYHLSNELARLNHKITIITSFLDKSAPFVKDMKLHSNITIKESPAVRVEYPTNQLLFPKLGAELMAMDDIDIIHAHGAMTHVAQVGVTIAKTKRIPFIYTPLFHPWRFFEQRPYRYTREAYESVFTVPIMKESSKVIAISPFEKKYLTLRRKVSSRKIVVIASGINVHYYPSIVSRRQVRKVYHIPEDKQYVVTFGTISDPRKGLDRVLKIFEIINKHKPNTHLIIIGWKYKPGADHIAKIYESLQCKNNISALGYVSEENKTALIKMSDVLISPTTYEAFGIVLGEAMYLEVPVVVTKVGGTPFVVRHGKTGYTVDKYNSIRRFAEYSLDILNDKKLKEYLGKNGKEVVKKHFSWKKIALQVDKQYKLITKNK